jgi:phosphopantothenoylcysteine decarboxylase
LTKTAENHNNQFTAAVMEGKSRRPYSLDSDDKRVNLLVGCSGSVATLKVPELVVALMLKGYNVLIVATKHAKFFLEQANHYNPGVWMMFVEFGGTERILVDNDEWCNWQSVGDDVLHIELRRWADAIILAPLSANTLAKASFGAADNLLLSVLRAWNFDQKPCLLCPAMNSGMWTHPATATALLVMQSWGGIVVDPVVKRLACQDIGKGAMASVQTIVQVVSDLSLNRGMSSPHKNLARDSCGTISWMRMALAGISLFTLALICSSEQK